MKYIKHCDGAVGQGFAVVRPTPHFWLFTSVSMGSHPPSYSFFYYHYDLNTCSHCVKEWQTSSIAACTAIVSVRFRSKKWGTRVKDHAKNGTSKIAGRGWGRKKGNTSRQTLGFKNCPLGLSRLSLCTDIWCRHNRPIKCLASPSPFFLFLALVLFLAWPNQKSCSLVFLCSKTKQIHLLCRLLWYVTMCFRDCSKYSSTKLQISHQNHQSYVWTDISLSCVVFVSAQELSSRVWKYP